MTTTTTTSVAAVATENLIRRMYRGRGEVLYTRYGLIPVHQVAALAGYPGLGSGLWAAGPVWDRLPHRRGTTVVTVLPIGYTCGDITRLRYDVIANTVLAVSIARWAGCRCVIYVPVGEERITAIGPAQRRWRAAGPVLEYLTHLVAAEITGPQQRVTVIRTDELRARYLLDVAGDAHHHQFNTLLTSGSGDPTTTQTAARLSRRALLPYLPEVTGRITRTTIRSLIAVGSLDQAPAIDLAARLTHGIAHLAHVPAPALTATRRMLVARPDDALVLAEDPDITRAKLARAHPLAAAHWHNLWHLHTDLLPNPQPGDMSAMVEHYHDLYTQATSR